MTGKEFELLLDEKLEMLVTRPQPQDPGVYYQSDTYIRIPMPVIAFPTKSIKG